MCRYESPTMPLCLYSVLNAGSHGASPSAPCPFLLTLTDSLLSLSSPTRGKYQLLTTLSHHLPVTTLLHTAPSLPTELLSVMGRQALACHVRFMYALLYLQRAVFMYHLNTSEASYFKTVWWMYVIHVYLTRPTLQIGKAYDYSVCGHGLNVYVLCT